MENKKIFDININFDRKICSINFDRLLDVINGINKHLNRIVVLKKLISEDNAEFVKTLTKMQDESIEAIAHELNKLELKELQLIIRLWLQYSICH